jgi:LysR family transcriptional regulator, glycine cleavage system transcriptional activator
MRHLPSFKALQAFESTMRHGTLSVAARDLNVTPGAISRQITALEDNLGLKLMTRHHEGITPNKAGEKLARVLGKSFKDISDVMQEIRDGAFRETLTLKVFPTFAIQWLVPRLANFHGLAPEIDLHIRTSLTDARFDMEDIDVAIMIGNGFWPKLRSHRLFSRQFTLVCSPKLLEEAGPDPYKALRTSRIIYSELHAEHWHEWLNHAGLHDIDISRGTLFENSSLAYQAARDGAGFALGQINLLQEDLRTGRLTAPFETITTGKREYYVASRQHDADRPNIKKFVDWLVMEANPG